MPHDCAPDIERCGVPCGHPAILGCFGWPAVDAEELTLADGAVSEPAPGGGSHFFLERFQLDVRE